MPTMTSLIDAIRGSCTRVQADDDRSAEDLARDLIAKLVDAAGSESKGDIRKVTAELIDMGFDQRLIEANSRRLIERRRQAESLATLPDHRKKLSKLTADIADAEVAEQQRHLQEIKRIRDLESEASYLQSTVSRAEHIDASGLVATGAPSAESIELNEQIGEHRKAIAKLANRCSECGVRPNGEASEYPQIGEEPARFRLFERRRLQEIEDSIHRGGLTDAMKAEKRKSESNIKRAEKLIRELRKEMASEQSAIDKLTAKVAKLGKERLDPERFEIIRPATKSDPVPAPASPEAKANPYATNH